MTKPKPTGSKVQSTHSREELIAALNGETEVYLAPYCNATRRLHRWLSQKLPNIKILGYLDSYKQDKTLDVWRIGDIHIDKKEKILVALERHNIRQEIILNLKDSTQSPIIEIGSLELQSSATETAKVLYHIYDLRKLPNNYEFFYSLVLAERERRRSDCNNILTLFVKEDQTNNIYQFDRATSIASQNGGLETDQDWFLQQVLIPGLNLLPTTCGYQILGTKDLENVLHGVDSSQIFSCISDEWQHAEPCVHYSRLIKQGEDLRYLQSPKAAREAIQQWLHSNNCRIDKTVVITLREASYSQERNSYLPAWRLVAEKCKNLNLDIVYIRDTFADFRKPLNFPGTIFSAGAWNLPLRFALYEAAAGNLAVNTGPAAIAFLSKETKIACFVYRDDLSNLYELSTEYNSKNQIRSDSTMQALIHGNLKSSDFMVDKTVQFIQHWLA